MKHKWTHRIMWVLAAVLTLHSPTMAQTEISNTTIQQDTTWKAAEGPFVLSGTVTVDRGATLTVEKGATIQLADDAVLYVQGVLNAVGTEAEPITFTTNKVDLTQGKWCSVILDGPSASESQLAWCVFSYGRGYVPQRKYDGSNWLSINYAGLLTILNASPTIANCTFRNAQNNGLWIDTPYFADSGPTLTNNTFQSNGGYGLVLQATSQGGWVDLNKVATSITGNTFKYNGGDNLAIRNSIGLGSMRLGGSYTWGTLDGKELDVLGTVTVPLADQDADMVTLTVPAGTTIEFGSDGGMTVNGQLEAVGTEAEPIAFRWLSSKSRENAVSKLSFDGTAAVGLLEHCQIQNARYMEVRNGADVTVRHTRIRECGDGIRAENTTPTVENCEMTFNKWSAVLVVGAGFMPTLTNNTIRNNGGSVLWISGGTLDPDDLQKVSGTVGAVIARVSYQDSGWQLH